MKGALFLALLLSTVFAPAEDDEKPADKTTRDYHVSGGGDNKALLMRVFAAVKKIEEGKRAGGSRTYTVRQRISATQFLVNSGGEKDYWFIALEGQKWDSRDRIQVDSELTDATKTFLDENGQTITVRVMKQVKSKPPPEFTKEEFVERLKEGKTWVLERFDKRKCELCGGDGRVEQETGTEDCRECFEGEVSITYLVQW